MSSKEGIVSLLINKRAFELAGAKTLLNPDYVAQELELAAITAHVRKLLSSENQKLVLEMESITNSMSSMDVECAYKQGLYDGMQILKEIASFGKEGEME